MATLFNKDTNSLAGNLLTLALNEALLQMPDNEREKIEQITTDTQRQVINHMKEAAQFNAGGT